MVVQQGKHSPNRLVVHPDYAAAKACDTKAAMNVVAEMVSPKKLY